jgi:hypothetical protein
VANPIYYTEAFQGQDGQTARAEQVKSELDSIATGFATAAIWDVSTLRGQIGETLNALPIAATRANMYVKFNSAGQPVLVTSPFNPRGAWAASTVYNVGDAYTSTPNGTLYYVKTTYTSGSTFGAADLAATIILSNQAGLFVAAFSVQTTSFNAAAGGSYGCDSSGGNITVTLPPGNLGDSPVNVTQIGGSLTGSQLLTIVPQSGQYIMGTSGTGTSTLSVDVSNASISLSYLGAAYGWRLRTMG